MLAVSKFIRKYSFEIALLIGTLIYYLFFVNKNLVTFDEGYFVHSAERILKGEIPYKDFSLQYGPVYFYLLAIFYKIFGTFIITGRFLNLTFCLLIIGSLLYLLNLLKIKSKKVILLVLLSAVSFGFPLINIPNIMWPTVLISILLLILSILFFQSKNTRYLFLLGILIALLFSLKQNFAIVYLIFYNLIIILKEKKDLKEVFKNLLIINLTWGFLTFSWIYYFFLRDNLQGFIDYINFSKNFISSYAFSYPPITNIFKPFGFFKLIPYYLPIVVLVVTLILGFNKKRDWKVILFSLSSCIGFFIAIYPQSDLLHVFPFFGLILVSLILMFYKERVFKYIIFLVLLSSAIGFYLTFFQNIYENHYLKDNTSISLEKTKGILVEQPQATTIESINEFLNKNTAKNDYVLFYPYHPLFYFIFERKNPSKDPTYYVRAWRFYDDDVIISEIKQKKTKYIITYGPYDFDTKLSDFIIEQKKVSSFGSVVIFKIQY